MISIDELYSEEEKKRLQELFSYGEFDTTSAPELDVITKSASIIFAVPIAYIALIDSNLINLKSKVGIPFVAFPKKYSFCEYAITQQDILQVEDLHEDERFKNNPMVLNFPFFRFCAGVPIVTPFGYNIGILCIADNRPRSLNDDQKFVLKALAKQVINNFELRKHNEELKILYEKTKSLSKAKEEFFSNMSHELRTPLNSISGFTEILSETKLNKKQKELLSLVKSSIDILITLVNDILDLSKIETGNLKIENRTFNLQQLVKTTYELLKMKADGKDILFKVDSSQSTPIHVNGDKVRLNQILMNLLSNAIKFTSKGYVILIIDVISESKEEIELSFSIKDTGIGIPQDKLKDIFERFHQVEGTTSLYGGSGLGLSISKRLVELQNGKIEVKSELEKGSEFSFTIKYKKSNAEEIKELTDKDNSLLSYVCPDLKGIRILLAEDNIINVKLIEKLFKKTGIHLDISENGKVCIEKLMKKTYDLILMDLYMPEMNGHEATKYIRNIMKLTIPIVGISANISEIEKMKCLEEGMNEYLTKPFNPKYLLSIISKLNPYRENTSKSDAENHSSPEKPVLNVFRKRLNRRKSCTSVSNLLAFKEESVKKKEKKYIKVNLPKKHSEITTSVFEKNCINEKSEHSTPNEVSTLPVSEHLNLDYLRDFTDNDSDFEKSLIVLFLKEMPEYFKELEMQYKNKNYVEIKNVAHKIKSPLAIFGLNQISQKFIKIEELSDVGDLESILGIMSESDRDLKIIFEEMRLLLDSNTNN